jgi:hypothetical protein
MSRFQLKSRNVVSLHFRLVIRRPIQGLLVAVDEIVVSQLVSDSRELSKPLIICLSSSRCRLALSSSSSTFAPWRGRYMLPLWGDKLRCNSKCDQEISPQAKLRKTRDHQKNYSQTFIEEQGSRRIDSESTRNSADDSSLCRRSKLR